MTSEIEAWIDEIRAHNDMTIDEIDLDTCDSWKLINGAVERADQRFFRIVGVLGSDTENVRLFIDQPEVGVLAFLFARINGRMLVLCQAKDEPGNEGITQLAPTIQATRSNFELAHGGTPVPYFSLTSEKSSATRVIHDSQSSEHGERFWHKHNRNVSIQVHERIDPVSDRFRWFPFSQLCADMETDFLVNTDARSVLSSTPWEELADDGRLPFDGTSVWQLSLGRSFRSPLTESDVHAASVQLAEARRNWRHHPTHVPLALERLTNTNESEWLTYLAVTTSTREIGNWCQPIYTARESEKNFLLLARRDGDLVAVLRLAQESGLSNGVEWSVTSNGRETSPLITRLRETAEICSSVCQTEEGSRFLNCLAEFDVVVTDSEVDVDSLSAGGFRAVSIGALNRLAASSGSTTNELRTAMSLLLRWF